MDVEYAYCNHCGSEYNEIIKLPYVGNLGGTRYVRCIDCGETISEFDEWDGEVDD